MATLPNATYTAPGVPLYASASGGSLSNLSSFNADLFTFRGVTDSNNIVQFDLVQGPSVVMETPSTVGGMFLSTNSNLYIGSLRDVVLISPLSTTKINTSSISTSSVDIDGQILTANPQDLLLNGIPVATTSNLSSIADWSLDPAISTVNMAGNDLFSTNRGYFSTIAADTVVASTLITQVEVTISSFISSISSVRETIDEINVSSISSGTVNTGLLWGQPSSFYQGGLTSNLSTLNLSTLNVGEYISTPQLFTSSINGSEFTSTGITVQVAGVSSLVANSISSIGAELKNAFVSTLQFNPKFSPTFNVDLGLGNFLGGLVGGAGSGVFNTALGGVALGTGIAALTLPRGNAAGWSPNLNSNVFETVNGTTQLQISTLGVDVSTIYRLVSSSGAADVVPGAEVFVSTIIPAGTPCIRSFSDPIFLASPSTQTSSIQSFGQWVSLSETVQLQSSFSSIFTSTVNFGVSSLLHGRAEFPEISVLNPSTLSTGQFLANLYRCSPGEGSPSSLAYTQRTDNRALVVDANVSTHVLLYTVDSNASISSLTVSSINGSAYPPTGGAVSSFVDLFTQNLAASTINMSNGAINMVDGGTSYIYLGSGGNNNGQITGGTNPTILLDGPSSSVDVPTVNVDFIQSKNNTSTQVPTNPFVVSSLTASTLNGGIPYTTANPPPAGATVSTFNTASVSSLTVSSVNGGIPYTTANPQPVVSSFQTIAASTLNMPLTTGAITGLSSINGIDFTTLTPGSGNFSTIAVCTITQQTSSINMINSFAGCSFQLNAAGDVIGVASNGYVNWQAQNSNGTIAGLLWNNSATGGTTGLVYASTVTVSTNLMRVSSISTSAVSLSNLNFTGVSSINFSTAGSAGTGGQPIGRLLMSGCDMDLQQNDLWCQQVRVGAGNPSGSAQTEVILYSPDAVTQRGLGIGAQDRTLRVVSTINGGGGGYMLDTTINPPLFSTINNTSTALMALFPSTVLSTIGYSTISYIPPINFFASAYNSTTQLVTAANTSTPALLNTTALNVGGFTIGASTITVPVPGTYELNASFQFATTSGAQNLVQFWMTKNGAAVPQTNSRVTVANNADNLGTISIFDTAAANDKYGWMFYSADANMAATAVAAGATPGIPALIFNVKRLG